MRHAGVRFGCRTATRRQSAWGLDSLMRELASVQHSKARFVERKYLKMLDRPLELSGTLEYRAPDHLERRTLTPKPESFVVDGDRLRLENARGRKRTFALQDNPVLWAFVESIRASLKGDLARSSASTASRSMAVRRRGGCRSHRSSRA